MTILPNEIVGGHYRIIRRLGAGGFGETYLVEDFHASGRHRAVKHFHFTSNDPATLNKARALFEREASVLLRITDPPRNSHIPRFFAYFVENQEFYLVEEFIEGRTLADELYQNRRFQEDEVAELLADVLGILKFLHSESIIHRDIKPENLMRRNQDGKLFVIDFGSVKEVVAQSTSSSLPTKQTRILSEGYSPLEQCQGEAKFNSDIYALGMTALELLTGIEPKKLKDSRTGQIIWPNHISISDRLARILEKMVHEDYRQNRYQSADAALYDVQEFRRTLIILPPVQPPPVPPPVNPPTHNLISQVITRIESMPLGLKFLILAPISAVLVFGVAFSFVSGIVNGGENSTPTVSPATTPTVNSPPKPTPPSPPPKPTPPSPPPKPTPPSPPPKPTPPSPPAIEKPSPPPAEKNNINCGPFRSPGEVCPEEQQ